MSTLIPTASLTGVGFANKVWAAMDGEVGKFISGNIEKVSLTAFEAVWEAAAPPDPLAARVRMQGAGRPRELQDPRACGAAVRKRMLSAFGAAPVSPTQ